MKEKARTIFNTWNWTIYILLTFLCGGVIGAIAISFLQIMKVANFILWIKVPQPFFYVSVFGTEINLYYVFLCVAGGIFIGLWQRRFGEYPIFVEDIVRIYRRDKNIPYDNLGVVFVASLMPIIFGGSVGLFAGFAGMVVMMLCWARDKYKSGIACILQHEDEHKSTRLRELIRNPVGTVIGMDIVYGSRHYTISKKEKWVARISAAAGGIISFRLVAKIIAHKGIGFAEFSRFDYTSNELFCFFPIVILGILTGLFFQYSEKVTISLFKPLRKKQVLRAAITGILVGLSGMFLPFTLFSGQEQMLLLVKSWESWAVSMLFATGFVKIILTNVCIQGGWRGGSFFPCIFCATIIGYGLAEFLPAEQYFVILTFMASTTAMALGHPLIVIIACMLFAPLSAILPIVAASLIGGRLYKRWRPRIIKKEEVENPEEMVNDVGNKIYAG